MAPLRRALCRRRKAELVDTLLELAQADRGVLRQLTARFDVAAAADELVAATQQAIADATAFDRRDINRNFAYDYQAYGEVKRNLGRLIVSFRHVCKT
jgi:light-regulated signal transduction histidine kinase (bacteriophytochrome)